MPATESGLEPIGDPDEQGDFAEEHESTDVESDDPDGGETESPGRFTGGMDGDGPP